MIAEEIYKFGDYVLYGRRYLLTHKGASLSLPPRLFETLLALVRSPGATLTKDTLRKSVWQNQYVSESNLTRAIADLRKVLKDYACNIKTISGIGYCFVGTVESINAPQAAPSNEMLSTSLAVSYKSIALISVLPFRVAGGEDTLGERCATATATELSIRTNVPVASPALTDIYRSSTVGPEVSHLLVGYIYNESNAWSVQVHFSKSDGRIIWATRFVFPLWIESMPAHVAHQICRFIEHKLRQPSSQGPNLQAVHLHGRALFHWKNRTVPGLRKGLKYAEAAIKADESFAQAHVTVANYYCALVPYGYELPSTLLLKAQEAALRALELDSYLADAHVILGIIKLRNEFDRVAATQSFLNAVTIDPKNYMALHWLGNVHCMGGQFYEAAEALREAYELNPKSLSTRVALAQSLFLAGDLRLSREWLKEILDLNPAFAPAEFGMGMVHGYEGDKKTAIRFLQQASEHSSGRAFYLSSLAFGASKWGSRSTVKTILAHPNFSRGRRYIPHYDLAVTQLSDGNSEQALQSFKLAINCRDALAPWLGVDPRVEGLSGSAEFTELLRQVNFRAIAEP